MSVLDENGKSAGDGGSLVAEYVLGVLDQQAHQAMARRIADDPNMQAEARFWQQRLSTLDESFEEVAAPRATFGKVETRLFGTTAYTNPFVALWQSVALWRGLAAGGVAVAALAIGLNVLQPVVDTDVTAPAQLVATLDAEDSDVKFLAFYDASRGSVRLAALSGEKVENKDFELWFIDGDKAPVSLGIVPVEGKVEVALTDEMRETIHEGTVLAVTLEPLGGGPGGKPSGPIVAAGAVSLV